MTQPNGNNGGDSSEPSSRAPVAFPDFRLFDSAQDILDHNKRIIKEIRAGHDAQTPETLARNCLLIRELNTNVAAVMRAYSSIGESFQAYMETQDALAAQQAAAAAGQANAADVQAAYAAAETAGAAYMAAVQQRQQQQAEQAEQEQAEQAEQQTTTQQEQLVPVSQQGGGEEGTSAGEVPAS